MGKGVAKAVENIIKVIAPALIGMDPAAQQAIDDKMVQARCGTVRCGTVRRGTVMCRKKTGAKGKSGYKKLSGSAGGFHVTLKKRKSGYKKNFPGRPPAGRPEAGRRPAAGRPETE